jgi:hypothetical protein
MDRECSKRRSPASRTSEAPRVSDTFIAEFADRRRVIASHAGLVRQKRIKQWTFYKRDEKRIAEIRRALRAAI